MTDAAQGSAVTAGGYASGTPEFRAYLEGWEAHKHESLGTGTSERKLFGWWDHFYDRPYRTVEEAKVGQAEGNHLTALYYFPAESELPHPDDVAPQDFEAQMKRLNEKVIALTAENDKLKRERPSEGVSDASCARSSEPKGERASPAAHEHLGTNQEEAEGSGSVGCSERPVTGTSDHIAVIRDLYTLLATQHQDPATVPALRRARQILDPGWTPSDGWGKPWGTSNPSLPANTSEEK